MGLTRRAAQSVVSPCMHAQRHRKGGHCTHCLEAAADSTPSLLVGGEAGLGLPMLPGAPPLSDDAEDAHFIVVDPLTRLDDDEEDPSPMKPGSGPFLLLLPESLPTDTLVAAVGDRRASVMRLLLLLARRRGC